MQCTKLVGKDHHQCGHKALYDKELCALHDPDEIAWREKNRMEDRRIDEEREEQAARAEELERENANLREENARLKRNNDALLAAIERLRGLAVSA